MMIDEELKFCRRGNWKSVSVPPRPLKPLNFYASRGIKPEKQTYTSEQDYIQKRTQLLMQFRRPMLVTGMDGACRVDYEPFMPVTSDSWENYQRKQRVIKEFARLNDKSSIDNPVLSSDDDDDDDDVDKSDDSESLPYDPVDASAVGLNHALLEEEEDPEDLEYLSPDLLDALDVTNYTITVTKPVVDDPLDIPAAGFNNSLLDPQVPEITASPVGDLVAESLLVDKHDGGPKGELVLEGSSFDPHAEDESLPCDQLNHPLLEKKTDLEVLSSTPLDALDATEKAATVMEPVVEGLPCDPFDIPAAGFNNSLLGAQVPENTASPVEDKHDVGPEGELVVEGSSFDPHGEDERLGKAAKKKAHQKMLDKKKRKSIVLSPGRLSMKKMKMGRILDGFSQDNMVVALFKSVIEDVSSVKKEVKTLKREFKSHKNK